MVEHIPATRRRPTEDGPNPLVAARKAYKDRFGSMPSPRWNADRINAEIAAPAVDNAASPLKRRRRASVGGHAMKLQAPGRKGYTRRWINDDGNRIADAEELAYEFVHDPGTQSTDVGSRVSRLVGTKANGEPLRAYLMETPDELYAEGAADKEAQNRQIDDAITAGVDSTGQLGPKAETYGQGSIQRD